jgi:aminoglycoside phosphotransferase (APT) family kinase protein
VDIGESLVCALLRHQHPDLAGLPLRLAATGWDNVTYRLGDDLAVRLPRITDAAHLLVNEQTWLPVLAPTLPVAVPVPVRVGAPGDGYPWPWSIVPWVRGRSCEHEPLLAAEATAFGAFLAALHRPATPDTPRNAYRGVPLPGLAATMDQRLERLAGSAAGAGWPDREIRDLWDVAAGAPIDVEDRWLHGDLHPKNIVVDGGRLAAVIDWGDMTAGDPATDLAAAWMLFPVAAHGEVWAGYGEISPDTMRRAVGWALWFAVMMLEVGLANDPPFAVIGRRTLDRVLAGQRR